MMIKRFKESTVINSFKESFLLIKKKKSYFAILFMTHLAFLIVISSLFVHYSIKIGENAEEVSRSLEALSPTMTPEEAADMLQQQSFTITSSYEELKINVFKFLIFAFIVYVLLGGINWDIANLMVNKESSFLQYEFMFGISSFIFGFAALLFTGFFLKLLVYIGNQQIATLLGFLIFVIVTYFTYISFGLINDYSPSKVTKFVVHTVKLGWKRLGTLLFSYFLMFLIIVLFAGIIYYLLYSPMPFLILTVAAFILSLCWSKIFFLTVVKNSKIKIEK